MSFVPGNQILNSDYRYSELSFRRFEDDIDHIVKRWPEPTIIVPRGLSIKTYVGRIREAMKAFLMSTWDSKIDRVRLAEIRPHMIVTHNGTEVYVGPRLNAQVQSAESMLVVPSIRPDALISGQHMEIVEAIAVLKNHSILPPLPINIVELPLEKLQPLIERFPNVEFIHDPLTNTAVML